SVQLSAIGAAFSVGFSRSFSIVGGVRRFGLVKLFGSTHDTDAFFHIRKIGDLPATHGFFDELGQPQLYITDDLIRIFGFAKVIIEFVKVVLEFFGCIDVDRQWDTTQVDIIYLIHFHWYLKYLKN